MHRNSLVKGLLGIFGVWLTSASLPMINSGMLKQFSPEELLTARGVLSAVLVLVILRGKVLVSDRGTYLMALFVSGAALGLYKGIRIWGAAPTIMVVTATPLVNFVIGKIRGRAIQRAEIPGTLMIMLGVLTVLFKQGSSFSWLGLYWSIFGTIMNGIFYELIPLSKATQFQKTFWNCVAIGVVAALVSGTNPAKLFMVTPATGLGLVLFALIGGFLYWWSNMIAFDKENLPVQAASVLAQGETITVILVSMYLVGEQHLSMIQWFGVALALYGTWYLARALQQE
ncbi:MAG: hypothetical protein G01um101477_655 [Candidatus Doudnabacteria bacterium Gr01-1014_77]|uniref:EamA domain-containing protein n=1 Tax=Candidatus Doudnabacteria bacterium Gr01-1014_77 TaxID=2017133 RepID=A0A554J9C7_9BACT|nr:MAG: hypothetical protein G01um101477_655 [Candidatus Doudnabacteria bacterium Gr01-1014_77]